MILCHQSELAYFTLNYPLCQPLRLLSTFHTTHRTPHDSVLSKQTILLNSQLLFVSTTLFLIHVSHNHTILCCQSKLSYLTLNYSLCQPLCFLSMFHTTTHRTLHDSVSSKQTSLLYSHLYLAASTWAQNSFLS